MATNIYKNPLEQSQSILYEKPKMEGFYDRYKEGYGIKGDELKISKGRMDDIIEYYGVWNPNSDYSKGYMGVVNPRDFVSATTDDVSKIEEESTPLDLERLNNTNYHPFLKIKKDKKGNIYIVGHEGRHRLTALANAGVNKVPIVFVDDSSVFNKNHVVPTKLNGILGGQNFASDVRGKSFKVDNLELTPINYKNAPTLWEKYGYNK